MDRDVRMYDRDDHVRYSDRPMLPPGHRSHSPEYRAPPKRSQRGGRGSAGRGRDVGGPGHNADEGFNILMNLSSMLS